MVHAVPLLNRLKAFCAKHDIIVPQGFHVATVRAPLKQQLDAHNWIMVKE